MVGGDATLSRFGAVDWKNAKIHGVGDRKLCPGPQGGSS